MSEHQSSKDFEPRSWPWGSDNAEPRVLHAMVRVLDLDRSLRFYTEGLGMKVLARFDMSPVTSVYLGFSDFGAAAVELEHNADIGEDYTTGSGFGHISLGFPDIEKVVTLLAALGTNIVVPPTRFLPGGPQIALVEDPDGYALELVQTRRSLPAT